MSGGNILADADIFFDGLAGKRGLDGRALQVQSSFLQIGPVGGQFGFGRFQRKPLPFTGLGQGMIQQVSCGIDLDPHIGKFKLSCLETRNCLPELDPVLSELDGLIKSLFCNTQGNTNAAEQ